MGYDLIYNDVCIGKVENKAVFDKAVKSISKKVSGKNVGKIFDTPEYSAVLTRKCNLSTENEIMDGIFNLTDEIVYGCKATVDGKSYIFALENKTDIVENYLLSFNVKAQKCTSKFLSDVETQNGYFLLSDIEKNISLVSLLKSIPVQTVADVSYNVSVDYETLERETSELPYGQKIVQSEGINGVNVVTEEVTYISGCETERKIKSEQIVSLPKDCIVLVGTAKSAEDARNIKLAHGFGFDFPLPSDSYRLGDSYGSGRNHKGYDILAPLGTPIFPVQKGTVILAKWYSGYGNCIDIDHGNGIVTRYAHCSQINVNVGDTVESGDIIGLVGSTGDAYGNHVHFEVIINGSQVNPAPYIGIE